MRPIYTAFDFIGGAESSSGSLSVVYCKWSSIHNRRTVAITLRREIYQLYRLTSNAEKTAMYKMSLDSQLLLHTGTIREVNATRAVDH
jgi:hypothetical protein